MSDLTPEELAELDRRLEEWPADLRERGREETVADLLAARELAKTPPLTMEDVERVRQRLRLTGREL